jgi:hypothetical protein
MESPYFFVILLFVIGLAWHSLLLRLQEKKEKK